ncbi:hypothetical protein DOTSEDRAFT_169026 [Dothistroma septosporum NZE10]|uniref:Uncharacterized protein n=1 Tax=Dothistroma septosporum (strain NZE10 / CBS 128990) TaxID=675120 RepID=N1PU12_DOTSN|nr:hypothetical protein DOTSEDRAFT_169026 [Dothistroma septosporum NZE10]
MRIARSHAYGRSNVRSALPRTSTLHTYCTENAKSIRTRTRRLLFGCYNVMLPTLTGCVCGDRPAIDRARRHIRPRAHRAAEKVSTSTSARSIADKSSILQLLFLNFGTTGSSDCARNDSRNAVLSTCSPRRWARHRPHMHTKRLENLSDIEASRLRSTRRRSRQPVLRRAREMYRCHSNPVWSRASDCGNSMRSTLGSR